MDFQQILNDRVSALQWRLPTRFPKSKSFRVAGDPMTAA
jgi:hypothetical protein